MKIEKIATLFSIFNALLLINPVLSAPPGVNADLITPGTQRVLVLPPVSDNAPVISLGSGLDPASGKVVEGIAIIDYRKVAAKPGNVQAGKSSQCFSFLSKGAKWKTVENWLVNGANSKGLDGDFVFANLGSDIAKWEDATDGTVGNSAGVDVFGSGSKTGDVLVADTASPDGTNEAYFADISTSGAIAVTIVWGIFGGPISQRQLVEWDQVYDDIDFDWSATGEAGKMDFENIATHEVGHSAGMGHPSDSCTEETMYRYADFGETKKRDLAGGDIQGVNQLY